MDFQTKAICLKRSIISQIEKQKKENYLNCKLKDEIIRDMCSQIRKIDIIINKFSSDDNEEEINKCTKILIDILKQHLGIIKKINSK